MMMPIMIIIIIITIIIFAIIYNIITIIMRKNVSTTIAFFVVPNWPHEKTWTTSS